MAILHKFDLLLLLSPAINIYMYDQARTTSMSLLSHLGASAADFTPYVPFGWRNSTNCRPPSSTTSSSTAAGAPAGAGAATAATYPSLPSMPQPLSRNQRRRRNKASRNSSTQPPPPPPPAIYQPAAFQPNHLPGYLELWMNTYNPVFAHAPPPRRRAVSSNFNYDGDIERWVRERGWGLTAPLA